MALDPTNSSNLEQLALKGLNSAHSLSVCWMQQLLSIADCIRVILCECVNMHHILIFNLTRNTHFCCVFCVISDRYVFHGIEASGLVIHISMVEHWLTFVWPNHVRCIQVNAWSIKCTVLIMFWWTVLWCVSLMVGECMSSVPLHMSFRRWDLRSPPLDNISVMVIVWRSRGNIIRTAVCWTVWHNVHSQQHTYMSSSYRSNRLGSSHWDPYTVRRGGCLELYCCNMVEWF